MDTHIFIQCFKFNFYGQAYLKKKMSNVTQYRTEHERTSMHSNTLR